MIRTEIIINSTSIDLFEDLPLSFTYSVQDIREPEKRNTAYSKTVTIPGSPSNNKLFTQIFDLHLEIQTSGTTNFNPDFNPNLKADVVVYVDTIEQFRGILKLDKVVRVTNEAGDYKLAYEVSMFGKLANIFQNMGDNMLTDLDFTPYNHTYNAQNITTSWSAPVGSAYVYPMIDYGATNGTSYDVMNFKPAIYVKQYLDLIFQAAGFQYDSTFLNSNYFKSLCVPFNGTTLKLSETQVLNRMFRASRTTGYQARDLVVSSNPTVINDIATAISNDDVNTPNFDTTNQYNPGTGIFTAANTGTYNFYGLIKSTLQINPATASTSNHILSHFALIRKTDLSNATTSIANNGYNIALNAMGTISSGTTTTPTDIYVTAPNVFLQAGEKISLASYVTNVSTYYGSPLFNSASGTIECRVGVDSYLMNSVVNSGLVEGDTIDMNGVVPNDIRQREFFMSLVKCFNLYVEEDKTTPNKLRIEPYVDYYSSGVTVDWSDKLSQDRELEIYPMGALDAKRYRWKYKEDSDYFNDTYQKKYNQTYGEKYLDIANDFLQDEKKVEVIFAATPLVQITGIDRIIPAIYKRDQQLNNIQTTSIIRLLYYGGLIATNNAWTFTRAGGTVVYSTNTTYPYAGHLDHPTTPTNDLCWAVPKEVNYDVSQTVQYTNNGLYNKYWSQFINEITDRNSKLIVGYFYLTPTDILNLSFQNKIWVDEAYYRLNKVFDYNPTADQLTKVELLKIKDGVPFVATQKKVYGGVGTIGSDLTPLFTGTGGGDSPTDDGGGFSSPLNRVMGSGNRIGATSIGVFVTGNRNSVGENCQRVTILNSSGCTVLAGVTDVMILNSSGVTVFQSGQYVISNVFYERNSEKIITVTGDYTVQPGDETILVDVGAATITLDLSGVENGKQVNIKKISAAAGTITISGGGVFIDGGANATISTQWNSYTILKQNNQFYII